jgi:hypothetical protein
MYKITKKQLVIILIFGIVLSVTGFGMAVDNYDSGFWDYAIPIVILGGIAFYSAGWGSRHRKSKNNTITHQEVGKPLKKKEKFRWFDTKHVKDIEDLSEKQVNYLKSTSLTIFGPFNVLFRKHWDFLISLALLVAISSLLEYYSGGGAVLIAVIYLIVYVYFLYFIAKHGRRLAWNRSNWQGFEKFERSEKKWMPWGVIFFVFMIVSIFLEFF